MLECTKNAYNAKNLKIYFADFLNDIKKVYQLEWSRFKIIFLIKLFLINLLLFNFKKEIK